MRNKLKNNREVAHYWANRSQESGRGSNMFFEGARIFSYGHHFEMARLVKDDKGRDVVLMNSASYSNSTSKHQGYTWSACRHLDIFQVPPAVAEGLSYRRSYELSENHEANFSALLSITRECKEEIFKKRKNHLCALNRYRESARKALDYLGAFRKRIKIKNLSKEARAIYAELKKYDADCLFNAEMNPNTGEPNFPLSPAEIQTIKAKIERAEFLEKTSAERKQKARLEREKAEMPLIHERALKDNEAREKWLQGEGHFFPSDYSEPHKLRVKDDRIETSGGAQISVKMALKFWETLKAGESVEGFNFGPYQAQGLDASGILRVGCHRIPRAELERVAVILGV